jgi:hypothetical protein
LRKEKFKEPAIFADSEGALCRAFFDDVIFSFGEEFYD